MIQLTDEQLKQAVTDRRKTITYREAFMGTLYFFYYLTLGYFFDYPKHQQLKQLLKLL